MKTSDFHFDLPDELIARYPMAERSASRLLCLNGATGERAHHTFKDLASMLEPGDLLVFNNTKVIPARLFGEKLSGGKLEALIERVTGEHEALAHLRSSRSPKPGSRILLGGVEVEVVGREGALFQLRFLDERSLLSILDEVGHMPLPPIWSVMMPKMTASVIRRCMPRSRVQWRHQLPGCILMNRCCRCLKRRALTLPT